MSNKQSSTPKEMIGGILGIIWLVFSALCAWSTSAFGISLSVIFLLLLIFIGNKKLLYKLTVNHMIFLFGVISFACAYSIPSYFKPIFKTHGGFFSIKTIQYYGFEKIWNNFVNWNAHDMMLYAFVPALLIALMSTAGAQLFFYLCAKETAEAKLTKLARRNRPPEPKRVNYKALVKQGYFPEAVPLGVNLWDKSGKKPVYLPFSALNKHVALVGTTGSGKTVTLYNFIISALAHKKAIVFIDGKGDIENIKKFRKTCEKVGVKPHIITLDGKTGYNPLSTGTPTELTDKLVGMFDWSEEHYRLGATRFLQLLIKYMQLTGLPVNLGNIVKYSDYKTLLNYELARNPDAGKPKQSITPSFEDVPSFEEPETPAAAQAPIVADGAGELLERIKSVDPRSISGMRDRLATLAEGDMAPMFTSPGALNLSDAIERGETVLFSVDSLRYPQQSKALGRLVTNDIKNCVSTHARNGSKSVGLFFDEFNVFASHEVVDIVNKSRSAGFEAVLSFQSLSDIDKLDNGEALRRQIIQNCNSLIVQLQNDSHDAEELSGLFGTYETTAVTVQEDETGMAGLGSRRMVHGFIVHPDDIKRLQVGQAFVKIGGSGITKVQIVPN